MRRGRRLPLFAGAVLALLAAACLVRFADDDRAEIEFWSKVGGATEDEVRALDDAGRTILVETLPEAREERTWRGVLEILDERSALEPLTDRITTIVDQEIDAGVRTELLTTAGDARLRQLILSTIDNTLAGP